MRPENSSPGGADSTLLHCPPDAAGPAPEPALDLLRHLWPGETTAGARLGRFEVLRELGRGGCGIVFLALDPLLGSKVALKVPRLEALLSGEGRRRVVNEARAAALLDHPNIVPVREVGEAGPLWYIASAYCEGPTLAQWLAAHPGPVPPREAAALVATLAGAVDHMHARGILHRDLKPGNILLSAGSRLGEPPLSELVPRITDFGLAKLLDDDGGTATGTGGGTPRYMAPEQAAGRAGALGPATDVHALGVTLYELLVGRAPFGGASQSETIRQVVSEEPRPPRHVRRDVPRDLEAICLKCLEKAPGRRYATAGALAEDLRRFLGGRPTVARPLSGAVRAARWCRRRKGALALVALCCAVVLAGRFVLSPAPPAAEVTPPQAPPSRADDLQLRRQQYALAIRQAGTFGKEGQTTLIREALAPWQPAGGGDDLRDFAWYWLWARGRPPRELRGAEAAPNELAFSADGERLFAGTSGGALHVWHTASGRPLPAPQLWLANPGQPRPPTDAGGRPRHQFAFAPGACRLAALRCDDTADVVAVWDTDKKDRPLATHRWPAAALFFPVALSPDGGRVALAMPGRLILWDWARDEVSQVPFPSGDGAVSALDFAPDGKRVAVASLVGPLASPREVRCEVYDTAAGKLAARLTPAGRTILWRLDWSPDGKTLAGGSDGVEVRLWDVRSGQERTRLDVPGRKIYDMAFSRDGRTLAVGTGPFDQRVVLYDVATRKRRPEEFTAPSIITAMTFSPDGRTLAVGCEDRLVRVWEPGGGRMFLSLPGHVPSEAWSVAFLQDAGRLASAGDDAAVRLWDASTGRAGAVLRGHTALVSCLAFSPRRRLIASGGFDRQVRLWDAEGRPVACLGPHAHDLRCLAFSPDGRLLATGTGSYDRRGGELRVWDVEARREVFSLGGHTDKVRAVAFSPDGTALYSASEDATARVWDVATGECRRTLPHDEEVWCLAVSPDGRTLVTGGGTGAVRFWDAAAGEELRAAHNHGKGVRAVAFSPDGKALATGGRDRTVRLWQVATGQELLTFPEQPADVNSLAFAPDGTALAAALHDGSVRIWQAPRTDYEGASTPASGAGGPEGDRTGRDGRVP